MKCKQCGDETGLDTCDMCQACADLANDEIKESVDDPE